MGLNVGSVGGFSTNAEVILFAGLTTLSSNVWTRVSERKIDLAPFLPERGGKVRKIYFVVNGDNTEGATSLDVRLYDSTHSIDIVGSTLAIDSIENTEVSSANLAAGSYNGNMRSDAPAQYRVEIRMSGGGGSDSVSITNARLVIAYEEP